MLPNDRNASVHAVRLGVFFALQIRLLHAADQPGSDLNEPMVWAPTGRADSEAVHKVRVIIRERPTPDTPDISAIQPGPSYPGKAHSYRPWPRPILHGLSQKITLRYRHSRCAPEQNRFMANSRLCISTLISVVRLATSSPTSNIMVYGVCHMASQPTKSRRWSSVQLQAQGVQAAWTQL